MRKPKQVKRVQKLEQVHQQDILRYHIKKRISLIQSCLAKHKMDYGELTIAAIHSRAIAGFLGLSTKKGNLSERQGYFEHQPGKSYEVKITDIKGGQCLKISDLTDGEAAALERGINETNLAFAHLTFWEDSKNQVANGRATRDFAWKQQRLIRNFARTVIDLFNRLTPRLPK